MITIHHTRGSVTVNAGEIDRCVAVLARSDRGRAVMRQTLAMLDDVGIGLDARGQLALMTLLTAAFTTHPGTARDAMREALGEP